MKKIIGLMLAVVMLIGCFSVVASADVGDNTYYESEPNTLVSYANRIYDDYTIRGTISSDIDIDHYKFVLYSPSYVTIITAADYSTMAMLLMNSEEESIAAGEESWGSKGSPMDTIAYYYLTAGTYYIALFNMDKYYSENDYTLYFTYTPVSDDSGDSGDSDDEYDDNTSVETSSYTWQKIGGEWYCVRPNGTYVINSWVSDSQGWCYLGSTGSMVYNQWVYDGIGWAYIGADGYMLSNRWVTDSQGYWCYLGGNGYSVINGWAKDSKGWCYLDSNGRMVCSKWINDGSGWYYINASGYMVSNQWMLDSQGWCYLGSSGKMLTNEWIKDSQGWCYLGANGYMVTNGWAEDKSGWCYMNSNGRMVYSTWVNKDGGWYYININGYMVSNCWMLDSKGWCYLGSSGRMVTNDWVKDSNGWCYLNSNGYIVKNNWVNDGGDWYYVNANGNALTGWQTIGDKEYYFYASGRMAKNTLVGDYWLGSDGAYVPNYNRYDYPFTFGESFEYVSDLYNGEYEITIGTTYSFDYVDNRYSDNYGDTVVRIPMTIRNIGTSTERITTSDVKYFGPNGQSLDKVTYYFDDGDDAFEEIRPGGYTTGYFYLLYSYDGTYTIEFKGEETDIVVELDIEY